MFMGDVDNEVPAYTASMTASPRRPSVLAYRAIRDARTTEEATQVYAAMKASACYPADLFALDDACPFYVGCLIDEDGGTAERGR
jgi:hypothetical protein